MAQVFFKELEIMKPKKEYGITAIVTMLLSYGGYETIIKPDYSDYKLEVQKEIREYVKSEDYNKGFRREKFLEYAKSSDFKEILVSYMANTPSGQNENLSLRTILAVKWDVEEKDVPIILYEMYNTIKLEEKEKKQFRNVIRAVNQEHPEHNVYRTE